MSGRPSFVTAAGSPPSSPERAAIGADWLADEAALLARLAGLVARPADEVAAVEATAAAWVEAVRARRDAQSPLDAFLHEYDLSSEEGVLLMCLAEALLRIPDATTAEALIADKLAPADWERHLGHSESLFVNASTWGLMLTGRLVRFAPPAPGQFRAALGRLIGRSSEPVIRLAIRQAMRLMGHQFVMGRTIAEALRRSQAREQAGFRHSFDMLGEAALTRADADRYCRAYLDAIDAIGTHAGAAAGAEGGAGAAARPGISIKLSALHPRYEEAQRARVLAELPPRLLALARRAREHCIGLTVDAEEADRLELSLDVIVPVFRDPDLAGWDGYGLAVQAYQKRALALVDWLGGVARGAGRRLAVRLVKGAYWDTEIKRSQQLGLAAYPVYTRKAGTDVSYLACARRLLADRAAFYPMFATHNAHTLAAVRASAEAAGARAAAGDYEFQRLHGMGEALYAVVREQEPVACRVYSPVGSHEELLPYLVRRLLENGANTSFVNRVFDAGLPARQLVADPVAQLSSAPAAPLPLPGGLFAPRRRNSAGVNLADGRETAALARELGAAQWPALAESCVVPPGLASGAPRPVTDPADRRRVLGHWRPLEPAALPAVVDAALEAQAGWAAGPVEMRAAVLERAADALEQGRAPFLALLVREAGKTLPDAIAEVREAVDFLRYYAQQARRQLATPETLPGPTGEHNELQLHPRGVFACISPWNFPLAIFAGQIAAALVTGNTVVAKPAEQTNLIAVAFVGLLRAAGVPAGALQCVLGAGEVGAALCADPRLAGVVFTGSGEVAQAINRQLAARPGPIATLIAETGGQNAMIVDSSALPEQVVRDVIASAFHSAGQRCSALRVLMLQEEIADRVLALLGGAMDELVIGDPGLLATDIGPVIDEAARERLAAHVQRLRVQGRLLVERALPDDCRHGSYFAPAVARIDDIRDLDGEVFGPVLHVLRYAAGQVDALVDAINATGYGLTLGVHSRLESTWRRVQARARVGNCYVNRGMTGAVVGVQPFGGEGRSGTGPKAGGPHYLLRFVTERTLSVNTAAVGGNASLLAG